MGSPVINLLKRAWHATKAVDAKAKWAYGAKASARANTDYRKVVLICNYGRGYLCNPKYIAEALNRLYPGEFDLVLLTNSDVADLPGYIRQVRYGSHEAQRELAAARFWIDNCRGAKYVPKREDQVYIQTWHAYISPKRVEGDVEEHLDPDYVRDAKLDGSITDLMFANNDLYARVYEGSFWYKGPVVRCGNPRNRPLIIGDDEKVGQVRRRLGIPDGSAVCLYAPTFRRDWAMDQYRLDFDAIADALSSRFGKPFTMVYRLHPNVAELERPAFFKGLVDATDYPDAQELLAVSDCMISDYSSILEDFALTGRPGFVYAPDIEEYMGDRGLYYSLQERPFPVSVDDAGLVDAIRSFDSDAYRGTLDDFFDLIGFDDDGRGDEAVARLIRSLSAQGSNVTKVLSDAGVKASRSFAGTADKKDEGAEHARA